MCGRMILATPVAELQRVFGVSDAPNLAPRYNIAPTQDIAAVRWDPEEGRRRLATLRWGLVPHWAGDPAIGGRMINARAESVADKPAFRTAFRQRRCLIPVDGFYEWKAMDGGKRKQPYAIRRRDRAPFALAGLWERWSGPKGRPDARRDPPLETATVVTTTANATLSFLHERMPVILDAADWEAWLDPEAPADRLAALLRPAPEALLDAVAVSPRVNSVRNDDEGCLAAVPDQPSLF